MESAFTDKETYEQEFNPRAYLETYCSAEGLVSNDELLSFLLKQLFKTFTAAGVKGGTLIDIGCGPSIFQLLSACDFFEEIIAADYCDRNRQEYEKWLKKDPGAFDWSHLVRFVCELEGQRDKCTEKEEKLRRTVKHVLKCDVTKSNSLEPIMLPGADCLLTSLCLEVACKDRESYRAALKNITSLLKVGGHLLMMGSLEETFYMVGHYKFVSLNCDVEFIRRAVSDTGYVISDLQVIPRPDSSTHIPSANKGYYFLVARKENNV